MIKRYRASAGHAGTSSHDTESGLALSVRMLKQRSELLVRLLAQSKKSPTTSQFLSREILTLEQDLRAVQTLLDEALALASILKGQVPRQAPL